MQISSLIRNYSKSFVNMTRLGTVPSGVFKVVFVVVVV
jgi:hypothetical protein